MDTLLHRLFFYVTLTTVIAESSAPPLWGWNSGGTHPIYDPGIPHPRSKDKSKDTTVYSPCGNNGILYGPDAGFVCPHMMMYSTDMLLAARFDTLDDHFLYAVGGGSSDQECGRCYQVQPLDPEQSWNKELSEKQLIIQVINSGFDVMPGHFDVFMAGGGFGYFTACNSDCDSKYCEGGPCAQSLYDGGYDDWNPVSPECYGGGIRLLQNKSGDELLRLCRKLTGNSTGYKDQVLWQSCVETNIKLYHQNFISTKALAVQCPEGLVRLTGLRRTDDDGLPVPHVENRLTTTCSGSQESHHYCMTSMQDCCMPSCSWMDKGSPDTVWGRVDSCKKDGTIWNYT